MSSRDHDYIIYQRGEYKFWVLFRHPSWSSYERCGTFTSLAQAQLYIRALKYGVKPPLDETVSTDTNSI